MIYSDGFPLNYIKEIALYKFDIEVAFRQRKSTYAFRAGSSGTCSDVEMIGSDFYRFIFCNYIMDVKPASMADVQSVALPLDFKADMHVLLTASQIVSASITRTQLRGLLCTVLLCHIACSDANNATARVQLMLDESQNDYSANHSVISAMI